MTASLIVLILALLAVDKAIFGFETSDASFRFSMYLDEWEKYQLFWRYDDTDITFKTKVQTKGYIGFGLSGNGGMKGSDIVIGWVKDGHNYFKDHHAKGNMMPEVDPEQNWKLLHAEENETTTTLIFTRPLRSCDTEHDLNIQRETQRIIWSFSDNDPSAHTAIAYHGAKNRGSRSTYLIMDQPLPDSLSENVQHMDILSPNIKVPSSDTTYMSTAFKLPELAEKHHIIGVEALIQPGNEGIVHHIILYACTSTEIEDTMHGHSFNIFNAPPSMSSCTAILIGWAIGARGAYLPENAGMPMGGDVKMKFVLMEMHYDNPQRRTDIIDNSGLRLFYTSTLRPQDAGVIEIGVVVSGLQVIPPHADRFQSVGYCTGHCTSQALADQTEGITIISGFLHSHLLGRKLKLRHVRNGTELPPIIADEMYDFNFQETRALPHEITFLPGDDLILECDYVSKDRTKITQGGLGTREEMCLAYVVYYPLTKLDRCESLPTVAQSLSFIDGITVSGNRVVSPGKYENFTLMDVMNTIDWTDQENTKNLEKVVAKGQISSLCRIGETMHFQEMDAPLITKPYVKELEFCRLGEKPKDSSKDDTMAPENFPYWAELEKDKFYVSWNYDDTSITFHVAAKTLGWVGFGLSPYGKMENSDVVIGWVEDKRVHFSDRFAETSRMPKTDGLQNWEVLKGWEENGFTKLEFRRSLVTCDPLDRNITEGNINVIWSYDSQDPKDASSVRRHSNQGSKVLRLMNGPLAPSVAMDTTKDGILQIEFKNPNVPVTSTSSTYYNVGLKMPELSEKYQIIKVEPLIQPGNEELIFHLAVYGCTGEVPDEFHGQGFDIKEDVIHEIFQCSVLLGSWIKGNKMYEYPSEFGFPIGAPNNPIKFIRLETLFSNPNRLSGLQDSSGLRLTLVPANRKHDVGLLRVGHSRDFGSYHPIPSGGQNFLLRGHCMADCLAQGLETHPDGITVIGVILHSHRLAKSITLRHIRNDQEIMPILKEPNFDFMNQEMVMLKDPVLIKMGDQLMIDCTLNTTAASKSLSGGPMADDQPCLALLMYYPPIDLGICESASPPSEMLDIVDGFSFNGSVWHPMIQSPKEWKGKDFFEVVGTIDFSQETLKRAVQKKMTESATSSFCFAKGQASHIKPDQKIVARPNFTSRKEPVLVCPEDNTTQASPGGSTNITPAKTAILCVVLMVLMLR